MPKPICVIYYLPEIIGNGNNSDMNKHLSEMMPDYHVFCIPSNMSLDGSCESLEFKVFYDKDFTDIQYLQLEKMIAESLPNYNPNDDLTGVL